jgi:micrococcal nuclease
MRSPRPLVAAVLGLLVASAATGCSAAAASDLGRGGDAVTVVGVIDGNTVELEQGGTATSVSLLGLESPALDQCLGAEAVQALQELLPAGTEVRVERSGEDLAAVYVDEVLINAEPARLGLGHTLANTAVTDQVLAAEEEAIAAGIGLFGADSPCTASAQVAALEVAGAQSVEAAVPPAGAGLEEIDRLGAAVAATAVTAATVAALLDGDAAADLPAVMVADLRSRTTAVIERLSAATAALQQARVAQEQRLEEERAAAEAAAARAAAAEAARQAQAAADAEAARIAAEAAAKAAAPNAAAPNVTAPKALAPSAPKATTSPAPVAPPGSAFTYKSCAAVRAAGAAPIRAGDPGWSSKLDRDGVGVACER